MKGRREGGAPIFLEREAQRADFTDGKGPALSAKRCRFWLTGTPRSNAADGGEMDCSGEARSGAVQMHRVKATPHVVLPAPQRPNGSSSPAARAALAIVQASTTVSLVLEKRSPKAPTRHLHMQQDLLGL